MYMAKTTTPRLPTIARNEVLKTTASWFRTISLGFMAVALIEPFRKPESYNIFSTFIAFCVSVLTFAISWYMLTKLEDEKGPKQ